MSQKDADGFKKLHAEYARAGQSLPRGTATGPVAPDLTAREEAALDRAWGADGGPPDAKRAEK